MEAVKQERATLYQFGAFFVDPAKCLLLRNGEIIPISLKAFEMLLVLVEHRGEVLEKDDLLRHLWPNTVVEENNLARNISALRKALDEHSLQVAWHPDGQRVSLWGNHREKGWSFWTTVLEGASR